MLPAASGCLESSVRTELLEDLALAVADDGLPGVRHLYACPGIVAVVVRARKNDNVSSLVLLGCLCQAEGGNAVYWVYLQGRPHVLVAEAPFLDVPGVAAHGAVCAVVAWYNFISRRRSSVHQLQRNKRAMPSSALSCIKSSVVHRKRNTDRLK